KRCRGRVSKVWPLSCQLKGSADCRTRSVALRRGAGATMLATIAALASHREDRAMPTLEQVNAASTDEAMALLDGIYEHSPWVARSALAARPFQSLAHLKWALGRAVLDASRDLQLALVRAHP